jgi:DNA-binding transcriptional LysR family regulator
MSQVDLASLSAFVCVAREGSVSKAAQSLFLTQPAVSLQLKALQERLGLRLFARSGRGLTLTRDGAALLAQAEKVLGAAQDFSQSAKALRSSLRGSLRIGTILDPEFIRLGAFLKELVEAAPHLEPELSQHMSGDVYARVQQGQLDGGFYLATPPELVGLRRAPTPNAAVNPYLFEGNGSVALTEYDETATVLVANRLTRFHYRVLAPAGWSQLVMGKDWRALAQLPWITTPAASAHHRLLREVMQPLGITLRRAALVDQEASMLDLVRSGVGLSLARDTIALREAQSRGLVVADRVQLECSLCFVYPATLSSSPAILAACQSLQKVWT